MAAAIDYEPDGTFSLRCKDDLVMICGSNRQVIVDANDISIVDMRQEDGNMVLRLWTHGDPSAKYIECGNMKDNGVSWLAQLQEAMACAHARQEAKNAV